MAAHDRSLGLFFDGLRSSARSCPLINDDPQPRRVITCIGWGAGKSLLLQYLGASAAAAAATGRVAARPAASWPLGSAMRAPCRPISAPVAICVPSKPAEVMAAIKTSSPGRWPGCRAPSAWAWIISRKMRPANGAFGPVKVAGVTSLRQVPRPGDEGPWPGNQGPWRQVRGAPRMEAVRTGCRRGAGGPG